MKRIFYEAFGPASQVLELEDADTPQPGIGEVLVELAYSGVNPSDVKVRAGGRPGVTKPAFPKITPHSDGAGTVVAVGTGVPSDIIGKAVWIWNAQWQRPFGTAATHIVVPHAQTVLLPDGVSMQVGACLGIPGLTAAHTVFGNGELHGKTVLVQGGAGTVGYLALQLARWGGARVIATARESDHEMCRAAGADAVIDFTQDTVAEQIIAANNGTLIDQIIEPEFGINAQVNTDVIAPDGIIAAYGSAKSMAPTIPFMEMMFKNITIDMALVYILSPQPRSLAITRLHGALRAGVLDCPIDSVHPLSDCAKAHAIVESGDRQGAVLVDVQK
ncbi:NADPH:quinone reductase [Ascidiaceihabitans sp.]|uniref:NADPH:quinone reductase n=1 Tax=Ascidiaceihabitans sp. TaxID=1872644 RepID=UPI0032989315